MVVALLRSPDPSPLVDLSRSLPVRAAVAFEAFADVVQTPRWFRGMVEAKVVFRDPSGRATRVQFASDASPSPGEAKLHQLVGAEARQGPADEQLERAQQEHGEARFVPISATTSLMTYRLEKALAYPLGALERSMQEEADDVVAQFCAHLTRIRG